MHNINICVQVNYTSFENITIEGLESGSRYSIVIIAENDFGSGLEQSFISFTSWFIFDLIYFWVYFKIQLVEEKLYSNQKHFTDETFLSEN